MRGEGEGEGRVPWNKLLLEKLPLLALSLASSAVTVVAQDRGRSLTGLDLGLGLRVGNALVGYARYLGKAFWPTSLAIFYPHPGNGVGVLPAVAAAALLLTVSAVALLRLRTWPWLAVGWCWFLGTLVPVIGLVQVGAQAIADRYTYLPLVGVFIIVAWGAHRALAAPTGAWALRAAAAATVVVLCAVTWHQEGFWASHEELFLHALAAGGESAIAHGALSDGYRIEGRRDEALRHARAAVHLDPGTGRNWNNLGMMLFEANEAAEAREALRAGTETDPSDPLCWSNLGFVALQQGDLAEATGALRRATALNPADARSWNRLGQALVAGRDAEGALAAYREAVRLDPEYEAAWTNLAVLAQGLGRADEAGAAFEGATRARPDDYVAWRNLGVFLGKAGRSSEAAAALQRALALRPGDPDLQRRLAVEQASAR